MTPDLTVLGGCRSPYEQPLNCKLSCQAGVDPQGSPVVPAGLGCDVGRGSSPGLLVLQSWSPAGVTSQREF